MGLLFEVSLTIFTVTSLWSTAVWFRRCSMTLLKNEQCAHELWNEGVVGKLHARAKHKNSHFHPNFDLTTITLSLVINLDTWLADFFCELAKELNKKARTNTKNKRNIFTLSALRYEMVDESVSIEGTLSNSVYFVPQQENSGCSRACVMNSVYNAQWEFVVYGLWYANWPTTMNFLCLLKTPLSGMENLDPYQWRRFAWSLSKFSLITVVYKSVLICGRKGVHSKNSVRFRK